MISTLVAVLVTAAIFTYVYGARAYGWVRSKFTRRPKYRAADFELTDEEVEEAFRRIYAALKAHGYEPYEEE